MTRRRASLDQFVHSRDGTLGIWLWAEALHRSEVIDGDFLLWVKLPVKLSGNPQISQSAQVGVRTGAAHVCDITYRREWVARVEVLRVVYPDCLKIRTAADTARLLEALIPISSLPVPAPGIRRIRC